MPRLRRATTALGLALSLALAAVAAVAGAGAPSPAAGAAAAATENNAQLPKMTTGPQGKRGAASAAAAPSSVGPTLAVLQLGRKSRGGE